MGREEERGLISSAHTLLNLIKWGVGDSSKLLYPNLLLHQGRQTLVLKTHSLGLAGGPHAAEV